MNFSKNFNDDAGSVEFSLLFAAQYARNTTVFKKWGRELRRKIK